MASADGSVIQNVQFPGAASTSVFGMSDRCAMVGYYHLLPQDEFKGFLATPKISNSDITNTPFLASTLKPTTTMPTATVTTTNTDQPQGVSSEEMSCASYHSFTLQLATVTIGLMIGL